MGLKDQLLSSYMYAPSENYTDLVSSIGFQPLDPSGFMGAMPQQFPTEDTTSLRDRLTRDSSDDREPGDFGSNDVGLGPGPGGFSSGAFDSSISPGLADAIGQLGALGLGFAPGIGPAVSGWGALSGIGNLTGLLDVPSPGNIISQALQSMFGPTSATDIASNLGFAPDPTNPDPFDIEDVGFGNVSPSDLGPDIGSLAGPSDITEEDIGPDEGVGIGGPSEEEGTEEGGEEEGTGDGSSDDDDDDDDDDEGEGDGEGEGG